MIAHIMKNLTQSDVYTLCRLYTGIHAKPKPKFKTGAISESTTALNVDQTNASTLNADQKSSAPNATLPLPSPLAPSTTAARGNGPEQPAAATPAETGVGGSTAAAAASAASVTVQKKEGGLSKAQMAEKKKIDARKKSLKRL